MAIRTAIWCVVITLLAMTGGHAADEPDYDAPDAWVTPAAFAPIPQPDGATARLLLYDEQLRYTASGASLYTETRLLIERSEGVTSLGPVVMSWGPFDSKLVVHGIHLIRDGQSIDLLARQQMTVLRREAKLEAATLDGILTATLQPEGVRAGDVLDIAWTVTRRDPLLAGQAETYLDVPNVAIDDLRLRVVANQPVPLRWRATGGLGPVLASTSDAGPQIAVRMTNVPPLRLPAGAPARFLWPRDLEISNASSWSDAASFMAPLYEEAARLDPASPVSSLVARIAAQSADPVTRAESALALVQEQVRYVAIELGDNGIVPASAEVTWTRRYGDCKGKTALLIAILRQLGIPAEPALVSTTLGDGLDARLPSWRWFDHVIVHAVIAGRAYWLDPTRIGDRRLAAARVPPYHWALPVRASGASLMPLVGRDIDRPIIADSVRIDASAGLDEPAPIHVETRLQGDVALGLERRLQALRPADRDAGLRRYWSKRFDGIVITGVAATFDPAAVEERVTVDGSEAMTWDTIYGTAVRHHRTDCLPLEVRTDPARDAGADRDAPYAVAWPYLIESNEQITLPDRGSGFRVEGPDIDAQVGGQDIVRHASIADGVFTVHERVHSLAPEFPASEAPAARQTLREIRASDLYVQAPAHRRALRRASTASGGGAL